MNSKNVLNEDNNDFFNIGAKELNEQDKKEIKGERYGVIYDTKKCYFVRHKCFQYWLYEKTVIYGFIRV